MQVKFNPISAIVGKWGYKVDNSTFKIKLEKEKRRMTDLEKLEYIHTTLQEQWNINNDSYLEVKFALLSKFFYIE